MRDDENRPVTHAAENPAWTDYATCVVQEVDMGFCDHHFFAEKDGVLVSNGCQRIKYCSCDCNYCSYQIF